MATPERDWYPHERQARKPPPLPPQGHAERGTGRGPCLIALAPRPTPAPNTSSCVSRPIWHSVTAAPGWRPHPSHRGPGEDEGWARLSRSPPAGGLWAPLTTLSWVSGPLTCRCGIYQASVTTRATSLKRILSVHILFSFSREPHLHQSSVNLLSLVDGRAVLGSDVTGPMSKGSFNKICNETKGTTAPGTQRGHRHGSNQAQIRPSWEAELWIPAHRKTSAPGCS